MAEILELCNGRITAKIATWGATITSLLVPDSHGNLADVVLGFDTLEPYMKGISPYFGCIVGRVANRIKDGKFTLNGVEYSLAINNGPNSLHGGLKGFDKVVWDVVERKDGNKATPINLAQHTYWNLAGHNSGDTLDHSIQIWGKHITPVDENTIPTGEIMPVKDTPFDFTTKHKIGARINDVPGGYDHNYVLDCGGEKNGLKHAAKLKDASSSRTLDLWTDAPGMQFYTANYVDGITA
ncbi:hypothetical protein E2562_032766 [Oryza meyeriana var. granulata]|uniref:Aldose 1-epimerase n=1 Tax=Oryza meyeriana var. granulata TaxID=110450 RepID=A0A6G1F0R3_9ORYZ|nr:hypothetical protein E2562_032766 [Oryza meyeriana var. granulata]